MVNPHDKDSVENNDGDTDGQAYTRRRIAKTRKRESDGLKLTEAQVP